MDRYRKILFLIIILLVLFSLFIIFIFKEHIKDSEQFIKNTIMQEAISYFNNIFITKKWNSNYGGVYVKQTGPLKPNRYLEDNHTFTKEGKLLIKITPSWMTRELSELSNKENKHYFKLTSLKPINPLNAPDTFEQKALEYFQKNVNEKYYIEVNKDLSEFNFMGVLKVSESCLKCHASQGYKIGDIRGGIRVSIPTITYFEKINNVKSRGNILIAVIFLVSFLIVLSFILFLKRLNIKNLEIENNLVKIKKLKESKEELLVRYEHAIEGSQEGLWDWNLITDEVVFSKNWKWMLGFKENELKNNLEEWKKRVHPEDKQKAIKDIMANQNKETKHYQNIHRLKHKDGHWVWILDRGKTYFDTEGNPTRMVGFHTDISELKNLEIELQKTKDELLEFRVIIESAPLTIIITDIKANILYVNPHFCRISGYKEAEILGKNPRFLKPKDETDNKKIEELWEKILNKQAWTGIFRNIKKDGTEYWETATILPILNKEGEIINYLGIMREITKEVYLEKELREKEELMLSQSRNAAMGEMISMIAHQWRQPITAISMSANNIIADIDLEMFEEEQIKKIAENISKQTQYLSKTIDDFRNFFKKDKVPNRFEFKELIDEVSSIMLASLKNNNIEFKIDDIDNSLTLKTYKRELLQVLLNVIKNAKEALCENNAENRCIEIKVIKISDKIKIEISDNAGGIKEENLDKIFNAYFTTKEEFNGTGLGLYMSKMIVEKHLNGKLKAYNSDVGAVFEIII